MAWLCDTRELYPDKVHARGRWAREVLRRHGQARLFGKWAEPIVNRLIKGICRTEIRSLPATSDAPFMAHCHILEHEDSGLMANFTVG